jgi:hypothetical protein
MRPSTPHFVLTIKDSITYGRHFYSASTISDSVYGVIHSFVLGLGVTNKFCENTMSLLHRIMGMWYAHFVIGEGGDEGGTSPGKSNCSKHFYAIFTITSVMDPHFPNIKTQAGLCDIMALGNLCELGTILDRRSYRMDLDFAEVEEFAMARWHYRQFKAWFTDKYKVKVKKALVNPMSVFRRSLVEFMAALVQYKYLYVDKVEAVQGCSALEFNKRVLAFINSEHLELVDAFSRMINDGHGYFTWTGPAMRIKKRKRDDHLKEIIDFEDFRLFQSEASPLDGESVVDQDLGRSSSEESMSLTKSRNKRKAPARGL